MVWMRNKENSFPIHTLTWQPYWLYKIYCLALRSNKNGYLPPTNKWNVLNLQQGSHSLEKYLNLEGFLEVLENEIRLEKYWKITIKP